ncbi:MAG: riboflavin biosynthesis protein RibF [Bacillota bacterium]
MAIVSDKRVLALGFFDSVHIGHRYLLSQAKKVAKKEKARLTVITFNDNFLKNLNRAEKEIYLLKERLKILKKLGYNDVIVLDPTKEFLSMSEDQFLEYILTLNPTAIVAGKDYTFGKMGKGNMAYLSGYMLNKNVKVIEINLQKVNLRKISTTHIKKLLSQGNIEKANCLLGENYFVSGRVTKGRGVGSRMGIPTANLTINEMKHIPLDGVYKTTTEVDNMNYDSITNVGAHPTFEDEINNIETMLIDKKLNLYNKDITVYFEKRIRDIIKFETPEKLANQIKQDIKKAYK